MWTWDQVPSGDDGAGAMRVKATLQSLVGYAVGGSFYALGHTGVACVVGGVATLTLLLAIASPLGAYAAVERALRRFGRAAGLLVGWVALLPVFLLFFVPFGLLFRRGERDPMKRRLSPEDVSYWREREPEPDVLERAQRQF